VVGHEHVVQWRAQLRVEPSSFARDLANVLLFELEQLQAAVAAGRQGFATTQAAIIRAKLATSVPTCSVCSDAALRDVASRLEATGTAYPRSARVTLSEAPCLERG
jgi:hypothetical protein